MPVCQMCNNNNSPKYFNSLCQKLKGSMTTGNGLLGIVQGIVDDKDNDNDSSSNGKQQQYMATVARA